MADYNHNANPAAVIAALKWELASATTKEHKAAIVEELDRITGSDTSQDRSQFETANGPAPRTIDQHVEVAVEEQRSGRHAGPDPVADASVIVPTADDDGGR
jgi:hypothetical protein